MPKRIAQAAERQYAEEFSLLGERNGMPRVSGRLLGWLLICDPPAQTSSEIAGGLGISRASVSIGTRLLEAAGIVRRTASAGSRGYRFEIDPNVWANMEAGERFRPWREMTERGLALLDDPDAERGARLRAARDFYAYVEREIPALMERFRNEQAGGGSPS
jgi:DNA-binding transcriptional regulator GbsR (MarR family)